MKVVCRLAKIRGSRKTHESMKLEDYGLKDRLQNLMKISKLTKITSWQQKYQNLQN